MILYHQTRIIMDNPSNIIEFDSTFNDMVWKRVYWDLVTRDITIGSKAIYITRYFTDLPPPSGPEEFIPYDEVDVRVILRWIDEVEGDAMLKKQRFNTSCLVSDFGLSPP